VSAGPGSVRAMVIHAAFKSNAARPGSAPAGATPRDQSAQLEEAVALSGAIHLDIVEAMTVPVSKPVPATLMGSGKVEEIRALIEQCRAELVIVNVSLTPVQQRNLETAWNAKVLDRTALILEIFGERAVTREGRLQVELAHLTYQRSRLVRSWTHLERQRGGFGFLGGPGETQIETDRRLIGERIAKLRKELGEVKRTRGLHRQARARVPFPIVALVGYTNAGKSTLFNMLTKAEVAAKDFLFATLDPTMRALVLSNGRKLILSDTVGFVSELPIQLVAAFRATLEEVLEADLILHVRDAAHADSEAQKSDVVDVLSELGIEEDSDRPIIEVLNKIDLLDPDIRESILARNEARPDGAIAVSALSGAGIADLLVSLEHHLGARDHLFILRLKSEDGAGLAWAYANGRVVERNDQDLEITLTVSADDKTVEKFRNYYSERPSAEIEFNH
jgi:GTP-binding protein HflX